jgi:hypothetical protein
LLRAIQRDGGNTAGILAQQDCFIAGLQRSCSGWHGGTLREVTRKAEIIIAAAMLL